MFGLRVQKFFKASQMNAHVVQLPAGVAIWPFFVTTSFQGSGRNPRNPWNYWLHWTEGEWPQSSLHTSLLHCNVCVYMCMFVGRAWWAGGSGLDRYTWRSREFDDVYSLYNGWNGWRVHVCHAYRAGKAWRERRAGLEMLDLLWAPVIRMNLHNMRMSHSVECKIMPFQVFQNCLKFNTYIS